MDKTIVSHSSKILILAVSFLLGYVTAAESADLPTSGRLIQATPFDGKISKTGVFNTEILENPTTTQSESVESLFFKASRFRYVSDNNGDHWQTPKETDQRQAGDCEDKAIWLFAQLKQNGYANTRVVIGKYRPFERKYHVWVTYTDNSGHAFVLDPAIQKRVWDTQSFSQEFYQPIYSFDGIHKYRHTT